MPPLVLLIDDLATLPDEASARRLATARIGLALGTDRPPSPTLPAIVERVLMPATACLAAARGLRPLQTASRQLIATDVADMATLERLARAGMRFADGPVFGKAQPIDG